MSLRTAGIEKPIIIQIDGETHACLTIHKIFTKKDWAYRIRSA